MKTSNSVQFASAIAATSITAILSIAGCSKQEPTPLSLPDTSVFKDARLTINGQSAGDAPVYVEAGKPLVLAGDYELTSPKDGFPAFLTAEIVSFRPDRNSWVISNQMGVTERDRQSNREVFEVSLRSPSRTGDFVVQIESSPRLNGESGTYRTLFRAPIRVVHNKAKEE